MAYTLEIIVPRPAPTVGRMEDLASPGHLIGAGGGPKDRVYRFRFERRNEAELAKDRVWCHIPEAHLTIFD